MSSTRIEIRKLVKSYPGTGAAPPTTAVDHVSLTIEPGELFFLLGPSGCGKTTLLRMIAGFIEPTSGTIVFEQDGTSIDVTRMPAESREIGMVFQSYALWPHMNVAQNVGFGLEMRSVAANDRVSRIRKALESVQLESLWDRRPTQLSGGQQQRVALARAMVIQPRVLLLDEPLSNLDARLRVQLRSVIRKTCKDAGMTAVYVTHDQEEALSMADRIAVMRNGRIEQLGTPNDIYARPDSGFVARFIGETNVLRGTYERSDGTTCFITTDCGLLRVPAVVVHQSLSPGSKVEVHFRPESCSFCRPAQLNCQVLEFSGTYLDRVYLGAQYSHTVRLSHDCEVKILSNEQTTLQKHTQLTFFVPAEATRVLPVDDTIH